jgi:hypothetical protein
MDLATPSSSEIPTLTDGGLVLAAKLAARAARPASV